jgi:hypothetical protein
MTLENKNDEISKLEKIFDSDPILNPSLNIESKNNQEEKSLFKINLKNLKK